MVVRIGSNPLSGQVQRHLNDAGTALQKTYEHLSSGQRINHSSDDSAGLAIAESLNVHARIYAQAVRNGNDGISLLAIADSTLSALSDITTRLKELAEQSANGTYSRVQREAMDKEAQTLAKEYFRVSRSTSFNGRNLFDGSLGDGISLQVGTGVDGSISTTVGGRLGTGSFTPLGGLTASYVTYANALGDLDGDGILDLVTAGYTESHTGVAIVRLGKGDGTFGASTAYDIGSSHMNALELADLNDDGFLDLATVGGAGGGGYATVSLGTGSGTFGDAICFTAAESQSRDLTVSDLNADGHLDLVTTGVDPLYQGVTTVFLGTGTGSFNRTTSYTQVESSSSIVLGDLNADGISDMITGGGGESVVKLGSGDGTFGSATSYTDGSGKIALGDLNNDGDLDLIAGGDCIRTRLGVGDGTFEEALIVSFAGTGFARGTTLGDLNGDGNLDVVTAGETYGTLTVRLGNGDGSLSSSVSVTAGFGAKFVTLGDIDGDGVTDIAASGPGGPVDVMTLLGEIRDGISPLQPFSLETKAGALQSMGMLDRALTGLSNVRAKVGAGQSRLMTAIEAVRGAHENFLAAHSRIMDVDVAEESSQLVRLQILQQASTSVLAQANQQPKIASRLLENV